MRRVRSIYRNPKAIGSFSGIIRTRNSLKEPVTLRKIKSSLNRIHSYGMHKEVKKNKGRDEGVEKLTKRESKKKIRNKSKMLNGQEGQTQRAS